MPGLQVHMFGKLRLQHGDVKVKTFPTRRVEELFGYLLVNPNTHIPREKLVETLWPGVVLSNGRASLSTALWRLRTVLDRLGLPSGELLEANREWIRFNPSDSLCLDLNDFDRFLKKADGARDAEIQESALRSAIELYDGVFCEGIYTEWCLQERERFERNYLRALGKLMNSLIQRQAYEEATAFGYDILECDPLREEVHRAIMHCYWKKGDRVSAVRQFQNCARLLQTELHILPMPETISLYQLVVKEHFGELQIDGRGPVPYGSEISAAYEAFLIAIDDLNSLMELAEEYWESPVTA